MPSSSGSYAIRVLVAMPLSNHIVTVAVVAELNVVQQIVPKYESNHALCGKHMKLGTHVHTSSI